MHWFSRFCGGFNPFGRRAVVFNSRSPPSLNIIFDRSQDVVVQLFQIIWKRQMSLKRSRNPLWIAYRWKGFTKSVPLVQRISLFIIFIVLFLFRRILQLHEIAQKRTELPYSFPLIRNGLETALEYVKTKGNWVTPFSKWTYPYRNTKKQVN